MLDDSDTLAAGTAAPVESGSWEGRSLQSPVEPATKMTWLERYEALNAENIVLSDRFSKGTLNARQFTKLQGNIDQMAFLFAVYREAGFPDPNLPIEGDSPQ